MNYLYEAASQGYRSARLSLAEAYLSARGYANVNQEQAMLWLNELLDSEEQIALETLRQLILEEVNVAASGRQM